MTNAKKILITTESHEVLILRGSEKSELRIFCNRCAVEAEMLSIDQAVSISGIRTSDLMRRIEAKEIHGIETDSGHILTCSESLAEQTVEKETENEEQ